MRRRSLTGRCCREVNLHVEGALNKWTCCSFAPTPTSSLKSTDRLCAKTNGSTYVDFLATGGAAELVITQ